MTRVRSLVFSIVMICLAGLAVGLPARAAQPYQAPPPFPGVVTDNANLPRRSQHKLRSRRRRSGRSDDTGHRMQRSL